MKERASMTTLLGGMVVVWVVTAILSLAFTVGTVLIVLHFVMKYW